MGEIVHQRLEIDGSEGTQCPQDFEGECRRLSITDGSNSVDIEVRVTASALISIGGRDVDDWLEDRVLSAAASLPNDGRKLKNLAANSPLVFGSAHVTN